MYSHRVEHGICIVAPGGSMTLNAPAQFKEYVLPILESPDTRGLIIDFGNLVTLDSYGIGVLVNIFKAVKEKGGLFALMNVNDVHMKTLSTTNLDKMFEIYESEQEALTDMKA